MKVGAGAMALTAIWHHAKGNSRPHPVKGRLIQMKRGGARGFCRDCKVD